MPYTECHVDVVADPPALQALLAHVEQCWSRLGESEPHWSVITDPIYRSDRIVGNRDQFYASGSADVQEFMSAVSRANVRFPSPGTCLELGCGVGRVSPWLAQRFHQVIAADISPNHLRVAQQIIDERACTNVHVRLVNSIVAIEQLPNVDCFFSLLVLQHNPPPVIYWLLSRAMAKLKLGGLAFFQLPTFLPEYQFDVEAYISALPAHQQMEMHCLPYQSVLRLINYSGCELLEAKPNDCLGIENSASFNFLVRRSLRSTLSGLGARIGAYVERRMRILPLYR
ncbi:MAG: class I SAM-dependent methyltransferase [Reyranellaceae bacterium]